MRRIDWGIVATILALVAIGGFAIFYAGRLR